jgi:uncharacterized protein
VSSEPFSHLVPVRDIPPGGRHYTLEAGEAERQRLAESLDIPAVAALAAELDVHPVTSRGFTVRGRLQASVVQTDVVTLEPVTLDVSEDVDVTLMPAEAAGPKSKRAEILVDLAEEDGPDLFHNGRIDLGVIVAEHLALGLDPYPRAPGTDFPAMWRARRARIPHRLPRLPACASPRNRPCPPSRLPRKARRVWSGASSTAPAADVPDGYDLTRCDGRR